jgi:hypothetical protein
LPKKYHISKQESKNIFVILPKSTLLSIHKQCYDDTAPTGINGPDEAWFRKTFTLSYDPLAIIDAAAIVAVDDYFELYVNGGKKPVYSGNLNDAPYTINIKPYLKKGKNVLALYAKDTGLWEWSLVDVRINISDAPFTVIYPNGDEEWIPGTKETIKWASYETTGNVKIDLSRNNGATWETIVNKTKNDGEHIWLVQGTTTEQALIRISSRTNPSMTDMSDNVFTIAFDGSITVLDPNGGEVWNPGTKVTISWEPGGIPGLVKIELSRDGGATWKTIVKKAKNDGEQKWKVTGATTEQALIRISSLDNPSIADTSDNFFKIGIDGGISIVEPHEGDIWFIGTKESIVWTSSGFTSAVKIELSRDNGSTWKPIAKKVKNSGVYTWKVKGPATNMAKIRISSLNDSSISDTSKVFVIEK